MFTAIWYSKNKETMDKINWIDWVSIANELVHCIISHLTNLLPTKRSIICDKSLGVPKI